MRLYLPLVLNCACAVMSMAKGNAGERTSPELAETVYVHFLFTSRDTFPICARAEHVACRMFAKAGVRINFHVGQPNSPWQKCWHTELLPTLGY